MHFCQNTQILKIFFSRNGRKIILSILKYSLDVSQNQRHMPDSQEAKCSVGQTLGSAGRHLLLKAAIQMGERRLPNDSCKMHSSGFKETEMGFNQ